MYIYVTSYTDYKLQVESVTSHKLNQLQVTSYISYKLQLPATCILYSATCILYPVSLYPCIPAATHPTSPPLYSPSPADPYPFLKNNPGLREVNLQLAHFH